MLPFSCLWFPESAGEAAFSRAYAASHFDACDKANRRLKVAILAAQVLVNLARDGLAWNTITGVAGIWVVAFQEWLWYVWKVGAKPKLRSRMKMFERVVMCAPLFHFPSWLHEPANSSLSFVRFLALNTEGISLMLSAIGMPLLMKYHLPIHALHLVVLMRLKVPEKACSVAVATPEGAHYVATSWRVLEALFTGASGGRQPEPTVDDSCRHVVTMTYLVFGFIAPSYALWVSEYGVRTELSSTGLSMYEPRLQKLTPRLMCAHGVIGAVGVACLWLLLHPSMAL